MELDCIHLFYTMKTSTLLTLRKKTNKKEEIDTSCLWLVVFHRDINTLNAMKTRDCIIFFLFLIFRFFSLDGAYIYIYIYICMYYLYIYIKPKPLKLPQFSTSLLFFFSFYFRFYILYIY